MPPFTDKIAAQIQKIPTKMRLIGFGVFIAVLAGLFLYFVHIPMKTTIDKLTADITARQAEIKTNDEQIKKLDELRAEVKSLDEKFKLLSKQLPPGSEVSDLLRQIQNQVSQSGLTLKLWRPEKRKPDPSGMSLYEEIPIIIELTGAYHDLGIFFDRVSKLTRIVNMLNLKMSGAKVNKSGGMEIKVSCTAKTFAAVEKKPDEATPATTAKKPDAKTK